MKKRIAILLSLVMILGMFMMSTGYAKTSTAKVMVKPKKIAFIMGVAGDAFYINMRRGVESQVKKLFGKNATLIVQGATEWDYTKQVPIVDAMIAKKVDMIIIAPDNDTTMISPLKKCVDAGIPVLTVDTNIKDQSFIIGNITSNNLQGGKIAADNLAQLIGKKGEVAIINTKPGITTTDARQKGFENQIAAAYPNIKIVSKQYCNDQAEKAAAQIQEILLSHPKLAGAFGTNLFSASGIANGLKAKGKKIPIMCYDAGPAQIEALAKGEIDATVVQKPMAIGQTAAQYAYYYFNNQKNKIKKNTLIESVVATKKNMKDKNIKQWFYTNN